MVLLLRSVKVFVVMEGIAPAKLGLQLEKFRHRHALGADVAVARAALAVPPP